MIQIYAEIMDLFICKIVRGPICISLLLTGIPAETVQRNAGQRFLIPETSTHYLESSIVLRRKAKICVLYRPYTYYQVRVI